MTSLTKLHLTASDWSWYEDPDFSPLSQFSLLQDLVLQSCHSESCCGAVLKSSRQSLRTIILTAASWTTESFVALQNVPNLETLSVSVFRLDVPQSQLLQHVVSETFQLIVHDGLVQAEVSDVLNSSQPHVHDLTLYRDSKSIKSLTVPQLSSLQRLTLIQDGRFTGDTVPILCNVTQLTFIDCPSISETGLYHMIKVAFPALKAISFHASHCGSDDLTLSVQAVDCFLLGRFLQFVDLRGVANLMPDHVAQIQQAIQAKQQASLKQPNFTVLLPVYMYAVQSWHS